MGENNIKFQDMSNSELKIKMVEMENEFESIKKKLGVYLNRMNELDNSYNKIREILSNRAKKISV